MIAVASRDGYARANVSAVIAHAGVSRPTFYDYFSDRDDCFLAAINDVHKRLSKQVHRALDGKPPESATGAAVEALVAFASSQPTMALFLMSEAMAGGPRALAARDRGVSELARMLERNHRQTPPATATPDISPLTLIGGLFRLLSSRLRRAPTLSGLAQELPAWLTSYRLPAREHRWSSLKSGPSPTSSPFVDQEPLRPLPALPPGRPSLSREEVAENHRQRILFATAELARSKGYSATKIADITRVAGIDGRAFYAAFTDKQDAFMTVHELGFQRLMSITGRAFFAGEDWPERIWEAGRAFTQFLQNDPLLAHVDFVEAHAVGPGAVQRVEDSHVAFITFLQAGYQHPSSQATPLPVALEATITTIFELIYIQVRASAKPKISGQLGYVTFLCLAPFLGAVEANRFIDRKLRA